ncbi:MAG: hypothetical protein GHCLOJNM_03702 [bacterium]|nr:hypothetical protein [bacterium]
MAAGRWFLERMKRHHRLTSSARFALLFATILATAQNAPRMSVEITLESGIQTYEIQRLYPDRVILLDSGGKRVTLTAREIRKASSKEVSARLEESRALVREAPAVSLAGLAELETRVGKTHAALDSARLVYGWLIPQTTPALLELAALQQTLRVVREAARQVTLGLERIEKPLAQGQGPPQNWRKTLEGCALELPKVPFTALGIELGGKIKSAEKQALEAEARQAAQPARQDPPSGAAPVPTPTESAPMQAEMSPDVVLEASPAIPPRATSELTQGNAALRERTRQAIWISFGVAAIGITGVLAFFSLRSRRTAPKVKGKPLVRPFTPPTQTQPPEETPASPGPTPPSPHFEPAFPQEAFHPAAKEPEPLEPPVILEEEVPEEPAETQEGVPLIDETLAEVRESIREAPVQGAPADERPTVAADFEPLFEIGAEEELPEACEPTERSALIASEELEARLTEGMVIPDVVPTGLVRIGGRLGLVGTTEGGSASFIALLDFEAGPDEALAVAEVAVAKTFGLTIHDGVLWSVHPDGSRAFARVGCDLEERCHVPTPFDSTHLRGGWMDVSGELLGLCWTGDRIACRRFARSGSSVGVTGSWEREMQGEAILTSPVRAGERIAVLVSPSGLRLLDPLSGTAVLDIPLPSMEKPVALAGWGEVLASIGLDSEGSWAAQSRRSGEGLPGPDTHFEAMEHARIESLEDGFLVVSDVEATFLEAEDLSPRWNYPLGGKSPGAVAAGHGKVALTLGGSEGGSRVVVLGVNSGAELWDFELDSEGFASVSGLALEGEEVLLWGLNPSGQALLKLIR